MAKQKYKIVYIGAGSFRFAIPCGLNILDFADTFHPIELWLVDIDGASLVLMDRVYRQLVQIHKKDITIHSTTDLRKALPDADYILISISIGLQESEWCDIHIPLKFGIPQNTGDTVGPGGIFRGLRTVPVIWDILKDIEELCPNATVINYTNPMGTTMLGALQAAPKVQSIGLCHEFFYMGSAQFGKFLRDCGITASTRRTFTLLYGGLNHFAWVTRMEYDGEDIYPKMREHAEYAFRTGKYGRPYNYYLLNKTGYFNYVEDRHITEFLPEYYNYFNHWQKPFGITKLRNVQGIHLERTLVYLLINFLQVRTNGWLIKLALRPMEGGEKALMMVKDRENNVQRHHVCNILNNGTIPSLPDNCVIELPCYFRNRKITPAKIGPLPNSINDWVKLHAENQQLVINAALSGDLDDLMKALNADPMNAFIEDEEKIEAMMLNMLYYQRQWLPKFSESIPTYDELVKGKYFIAKTELSTNNLARREKYSLNPQLKMKSWPLKYEIFNCM
jgi:alpha-galactosidase